MIEVNWVDRGDLIESALSRVLGYAVERSTDDPELCAQVLIIRGMAEADSTEVHVAGYLRTVAVALDQHELEPTLRRTLAIALWHIAKTGLLRDTTARRTAEMRRTLPPEPPLADRLHEAITGAPVEPHAEDPLRRRPQ